MTRTWLAQLGLLVLLTLCLVGCQQQPGAMRSTKEAVMISTPTVAPSPAPEDVTHDVGSYPCGPLGYSINLGEGKIFLAWMPDGAHLVFNYYAGGKVRVRDVIKWNIFTGIWVVDAAGSRLEMLVDANPSRESQYGHHADVSPDGTQLVYASCEYPFPPLKQNPERIEFNFEVAIIGIDGTGQRRLTRNPRPRQLSRLVAGWQPCRLPLHAAVLRCTRGNGALHHGGGRLGRAACGAARQAWADPGAASVVARWGALSLPS